MSDGLAPTEPGIWYSLVDFGARGSWARPQTIGNERDGSGAIQLPSHATKLPDQWEGQWRHRKMRGTSLLAKVSGERRPVLAAGEH